MTNNTSRCLVPMGVMLLWLTTGNSLTAQPVTGNAAAPPKVADPFEQRLKSLESSAYSMPPELGADILLRMAELDHSAVRRQRPAILDQAFRLASGSSRALPVRYLLYNGDTQRVE